MKKSVFALICTVLIISNGLFSSSLSLLSVEDATMDQLVLMCNVRLLSTDGSKTELKNRLQDYMKSNEGAVELDEVDTSASSITDENKYEPIISNPYILEIINAQTLTKTGDEEPLIILEGSSKITFQKNEDDEPQILSAAKIVVDLAHKRLSALGSVTFESTSGSENESFQNIEGEIVSLDWQTNAINVAGGSIATTRDNSDGDSVTFTAYSKELSYNSKLDSFILKKGYVTSNSDTAYSSITADKLALLPNGDMFLKNAYISIGRVPVLWLPYFYSPGATMVGNPSIGYETSRGLFVNTTFEIFGKYPSFKTTDRSSFSTLLSTSSDATLYPTSSIYTSTDDLSDTEIWAKENENYLSLMFDGYQYTPYRSESNSVDTSVSNDDTQAFALGYATELNLFNDKVKVKSATMASLTSDGIVGEIKKSSDFPVFRYNGEFNLNYDSDYVDLKLNLPYSSDPKAKKAYSNRLSTFSLDTIWNKNQTFPTTYSSDLSSYVWKLNCDIDVPTNFLGDYVQALKFTALDATVTNTWKDVGASYSYNITNYTIPNVQAKMSGQLFNFSLSEKDDKVVDEKASDAKENKAGKLPYLFSKQGFETLSYNNLDTDEIFKYLEKVRLEKEKIRELEEIESKIVKIGEIDKLVSGESATTSAKGSYFSLDYLITEDYYKKLTDITYDTAGDYNSSTDLVKNKTDLDFDLLLDIKPSVLKINSGLHSEYLYKLDTVTTNNVTVQTDNAVTLPFLGLSYYFNSKLYTYSDSTEVGISTKNESFDFTDDWVTKHAVSLSKAFDINKITITPALSLQLPPLALTLSPSLQIKGFGFTNNLSAKLDIDGTFELDSITDTLKYSKDYFSTSLKIYYNFENAGDYDRLIDPLQLSGHLTYNNDDISQKISQSFSYYGEKDKNEDYFDEIKTTYTNKYLTSVLNLSTDVEGDKSINLDYFKNTLKIKDLQQIWWKNRAGYNLDASAIFNWDFRDKYSTYFQLETSLSFAIAEFLTCDFSVTTSNHGFYNYYDNDKFNFSEMFLDLGRAFDVFGNGRYSTNFNLEDISFEFIHYMEDWDLHCKYTGTVVLSSYEYSWVPTVTFYLQWKTIPELKIDESFTQTDDVWTISN
jgi:hypothetical protein